MGNLSQLRNTLKSESTKKKFEEMLGENARSFMTSIISLVSSNNKFEKVSPESIIMAAGTAASLNLPVNPNLGFAYIIPYGTTAQFQIGYKGLIQLCQRSGKFKTINVTDVKEFEITGQDRKTGEKTFSWIEDEEHREKAETVGYLAYFELLNGFSKTLYMSVASIEAHAKKFSKTYSFKDGVWKTNKEKMSMKTVLKLLLSNYAPMTIDTMEAIIKDQSITVDGEVIYPDNESLNKAVNITNIEPKTMN